jgi:hypothetical protein
MTKGISPMTLKDAIDRVNSDWMYALGKTQSALIREYNGGAVRLAETSGDSLGTATYF